MARSPFGDLIPKAQAVKKTSSPFMDLLPKAEESVDAPAVEPKSTLTVKPEEVSEVPFQDVTAVDAFFLGAREGTKDIGRDIELLIRDTGEFTGILDEGGADRRRDEISSERAQIENLPAAQEFEKTFKGTRFGTTLLGELAGPAKLAKGAGLVGRGVKGLLGEAGIGAALGGLQDPGKEGSRLGGLVTGGVLSAGIGSVFRAGSALAGRGKVSEAAQNAKIFDKFKVQPSVGQLRGAHQVAKGEKFLRDVPVIGTNKFFKGQFKQIKDSIFKWVDEIDPPQVRLEGTGQVLQKSLKRQLDRVSTIETKLYDKLAKKVDTKGFQGEIMHAKESAKAALRELDGIPIPSKRLEAFKEHLKSYVDVGPMNFKQAHVLRQTLDDELSALTKKTSLGNALKGEVRALAQLRAGLEKDLEAFASSKGAGAAYGKAKDFFFKHKLPFNDVDLRKAVDPNKLDVDTIITKFIKPDRPELAQKLIKGLDKEGRKALEFGLVDKAMHKAVDPITGLNPTLFVKELTKFGKTADVTFSKSTKESVEGLARLIDLTKAAHKPGGLTSRFIPGGSAALGAGGFFFNPAIAGSVAVSAKLVSKLLTTKVGLKLLTKVRDLKPGSIQMRDTLTKLNEAVATLLSTGE